MRTPESEIELAPESGDGLADYRRRWRAQHPTYNADYQKAVKNNPAYAREQRLRRQAKASERRASDPAYRLACLLRCGLYKALKGSQKSERIQTLLGCSFKEAQQHIERQFTRGMTWDNWGEVWHVDHIRPLASFDLTKPEQLAQVCHFTNLRPLPKSENLAKGARQEFLI